MSSAIYSASIVLALVGLLGCAADAPVDEEPPQVNLAVKQAGREFGNCTQAEINELGARMAEASAIADEASVNWNNPAWDSYYLASYAWFGRFGSDNIGRVVKGVARSLHDGNAFQYWCNPPKNPNDKLYNPACGDREWIARQVNFGSMPTIVLCRVFWEQPQNGRTLAILHEVSHVNGTRDITYDMNEAKNLAKTNPDAAAANAFNYEQYYKQLMN